MQTDTDTRSAVAEMFAKASADPAQDAPEPAGDDGGAVDTTPAAEPERAPAAPAGRDEKGRFAKGGGKESAEQGKAAPPPLVPDAAAGQGAAPEASAGASVAVPDLPELKAPQDWRAAPREKWASLPREAQEEILRTYGETRKTLDRAAALDKEIEPWRAATQPYSHLFGGAQPHQVIGGLLRSLSVLQTGHPQQRAQVVAGIVRDYIGTDEAALTMLGQVIHGGGAGQPVQAPQPMSQEQIRQLAREEWDSAQAQGQRAAAVKTWRDFEAANGEFLNEPGFRQRLAIELQVAMTEKGDAQPTKEDLQKAYDAACQAHPTASKIVKQRKDAAAAKAKNASTTAAAASGLKNEPAGPNSGTGDAKDTREEVARQFKKARQARV